MKTFNEWLENWRTSPPDPNERFHGAGWKSKLENHNFKEWIVLYEGQNENQALALLNGDQQLLQQLSAIAPHPKFLPVLAYFYILTFFFLLSLLLSEEYF